MKDTGSKIINYAIWGLIILLCLTLVKNIVRNNQIHAQVQAEKDKLAKIIENNKKLESEVAMTQSTDFIEKQMRDKLGLGKEGEAMVVLPDTDTLRKLAPIVPVETDTLPDPNWKKWLQLFISVP